MQITRWQLILQSRLSWMSTMPQNKLLTTQYANLFKYRNTGKRYLQYIHNTSENVSHARISWNQNPNAQTSSIQFYHRQAGGKSVMTSVQRTELHRLLRAKGRPVREVRSGTTNRRSRNQNNKKKQGGSSRCLLFFFFSGGGVVVW